MSGQGTERPDEVIEHGPVTLRRYREDDLEALHGAAMESLDPPPEGGNGHGVVWRLLKTQRPNEVT